MENKEDTVQFKKKIIWKIGANYVVQKLRKKSHWKVSL